MHKKSEQSVDIPESQKNIYLSFFENVKKNKRGELILLKDEGKNQRSDSNKKVKYFFHAMPNGSVRAKTDSTDAFVSFTELSAKNTDKSNHSSGKKRPTNYILDSYGYTNDSRTDKKIEYKKKPKRISQVHNLSCK